MKKSLLALAAMSAFVGTAQAQSSVTVYGIFDGGLNSNVRKTTIGAAAPTIISNSDFTGNQQTSSRIGFRGVEDLGKGLSANFTFELGFNAGTGSVDTVTTYAGTAAQTDSVRTAVVGLNSKQFGELRVGRQLTGIFAVGAGDIFTGSNMVGDIIASSHSGAGATNTTNTRVYVNATRMNGVSYHSLNFSGFTARLDYSNNLSSGANFKSDGAVATVSSTALANGNITGAQSANQGLSAKYAIGPVTVAAGTHKVSTNTNVSTLSGAVSEQRINIASIMYQQGPFSVQLTHGQNKLENKQTALQTSKLNANKIAVQYAVTPVIVPFAMYGTGKSEMSVATPTQADNTAYLFGTNYNLSKRTRLYAVYGFQKSDIKSTTTTAETKEYGLGVVHTF